MVREAFAGFGAEDPAAIADTFHPDGELLLNGGLALLTGERHEGRDAVRAWFRDWFATMELTAAGVEHMAPVGVRDADGGQPAVALLRAAASLRLCSVG